MNSSFSQIGPFGRDTEPQPQLGLGFYLPAHNLSGAFCDIVERRVAQCDDLIEQQQSLFSQLDLRQIRHSSLNDAPLLEMSPDALQTWKQRIVQYQQQVYREAKTSQGMLFDLSDPATDPDTINPFCLRPQNIEFWRWPISEPGLAALYFVIDHEFRLLLYVGETCKANQRWKGVHDCKRYVRNYITAHRMHSLGVNVSIGFWTHAPTQTRPRQRMELRLIEKWRSPFNKENWKHWGTPFI